MESSPIPKISVFAEIGDDHESFARLAPKMQKRILLRLEQITMIEEAVNGEKGKAVIRAAAALGVSIPTVNRFVRDYRVGGLWALCDERGKSQKALPQAFQGFIKQLHLQCQRSSTGKEVHRMLIERWRLWQRTGDDQHAIPGYDTPPPAGPAGYPHGWSADNLCRLRPDSYALSLVRQGAKSAAGYLPSILKTRVGTRFASVIFFDDQDLDLKVAPRGMSQKALRPQGFNCLDYFSGAFLHHVIRLRWWDTDGEQYRTLTSEDFTWFVVAFLQKHGYRRDAQGTTFVFENGTATGYNNRKLATSCGYSSFDEALAGISGGCIRVDRSGLYNQPAFAGMLFRPASSGNPNFKAPLESMFNLVRNRMAALPGAMGRNNREQKLAEQHGADLYTEQMLKLWERLDERHRELIRFPMMTPEELGNVSNAIYEAINSRTDHALEGWEQMGFVAPQFRFTPDERSPWLSRDEVMNLPADARAVILAKTEIAGHVRPWKLSPADVARQCAGELTKIPDSAIPQLIPLQWARPATVRENRTISIKDALLGPEALQYVCRIEDRDGSARVLKPGMEILAFLNPFATERLCVCREDGAYLGTLQQMTRAGFTDHQAILSQLKERAKLRADLDTGVRPHLEALMADRAEMKRVNSRLANGQPVLPEEVAAARAESAMQGQRTAAANRLQDHGTPTDWDAIEDSGFSPIDPFAALPDEVACPESI
jgi:hypothetical protein